MRGVGVGVAALVTLLGSCKGHKPTRPLAEAIVGEWDEWCHTDKQLTSTCLGKDDFGLYKVFEPGGGLEAGSHKTGVRDHGSWSLSGDEVVLTFDGGDTQLTERYRARIDDDRLVLWDAERGFGSVLGRAGTTFAPAAGPTTTGGLVTHRIGGVRYTIGLPSGYRLARDDNDRQRWEAGAGAGLEVELTLSPRAHEEVDGKPVVTPCSHGDPGVSSSGQTIHGIERVTGTGLSICIDPGEQALACSAGHSRGYLEPSEKDAALALCRSLKIVP